VKSRQSLAGRKESFPGAKEKRGICAPRGLSSGQLDHRTNQTTPLCPPGRIILPHHTPNPQNKKKKKTQKKLIVSGESFLNGGPARTDREGLSAGKEKKAAGKKKRGDWRLSVETISVAVPGRGGRVSVQHSQEGKREELSSEITPLPSPMVFDEEKRKRGPQVRSELRARRGRRFLPVKNLFSHRVGGVGRRGFGCTKPIRRGTSDAPCRISCISEELRSVSTERGSET